MSIFRPLPTKPMGMRTPSARGDCTSQEMKDAIAEWFELFYRKRADQVRGPPASGSLYGCEQDAKTAFGEYTFASENAFASGIMDALYDIHARAMHDALIGGLAYIKPFPLG